MAVNRNRTMNKIKSTVREADQPVRQRRSAKSNETNPVSRNADEKKKNMRQRPPWTGMGCAVMVQCVRTKIITRMMQNTIQTISIFRKGKVLRFVSVVIGPRSNGRAVILES